MALIVPLGIVSTETAAWADTSVGSSFTNGLYPGQYIIDPTGMYALIMQTDGNLVLYELLGFGLARDKVVCWASGTENTPGAYAYFLKTPWWDPDPNRLVVRDGCNNEIRSYQGDNTDKSNEDVNVNENSQVWIGYTLFHSCW
jgi:hypothetical protein